MHVLINAASANMGGAVTYLQNVLRWLPRVAPEDNFTVFVPRETIGKLADTGEARNVDIRAYPYENTGGKERFYFDQVLLPRLVRSSKVDVLFSSTGFGTYVSPCPQVLLVRNLAYFDRAFHARYRELGRSLRRNTFRRWLSIVSIKTADVVLFPTRGMQEMVEGYVSLGGRRAEAIHYGFDHEAFSARNGNESELCKQIEGWKSQGYNILLNVSTFAVQKNYETLVEALPHVKATGCKVKVLLTISREKTTDKAEYDALMRRAADLGVDGDLVEVGYVPYQQLGALYRSADLYVFPSFSESFGHSLVEAMASGLPVVAAGSPVNREVAGDAGIYFDSFDPVHCASKIVDVISSPQRRHQLREASLNRAKHFSWESYATKLVGVFREAVANSRR